MAAFICRTSIQVAVGHCAAEARGDGSSEAIAWSLEAAGAWECMVYVDQEHSSGTGAGSCAVEDEWASSWGCILELAGARTGTGSCI